METLVALCPAVVAAQFTAYTGTLFLPWSTEHFQTHTTHVRKKVVSGEGTTLRVINDF